MPFSICTKPINWEKPEFQLGIEILFRTFFKKAGYRKVTENQLVNEVAKRARSLSEELVELLELDDDEGETKVERTTIKLLKELKKTVTSAIIENLDHKLILSRDFLSAHSSFSTQENLVTWEEEPTAENLLVFISQNLFCKFPVEIKLVKLKLYETKDSYAEWRA